MDNYQKLEQLVNKAGCSYEDAKAALEACGWDMIDAIISLEREGKVNKETVVRTTQKAEDMPEIISEITVAGDSDNTGGSGSYNNDHDAAGDEGAGRNNGRKESRPRRLRQLLDRFKSIMTKNRMIIFRSNGQLFMDLPVWVTVIALIAFFWPTLIASVISMLFGFRFHFEGEDLGKTNINNTMDKATDYAEKVWNDLAGKANGRQNTDN